MTPPLLTFAQAIEVGRRPHDHWQKMAGSAPMERDDMGWGDLVQQCVRFSRDVVQRDAEARDAP